MCGIWVLAPGPSQAARHFERFFDSWSDIRAYIFEPLQCFRNHRSRMRGSSLLLQGTARDTERAYGDITSVTMSRMGFTSLRNAGLRRSPSMRRMWESHRSATMYAPGDSTEQVRHARRAGMLRNKAVD